MRRSMALQPGEPAGRPSWAGTRPWLPGARMGWTAVKSLENEAIAKARPVWLFRRTGVSGSFVRGCTRNMAGWSSDPF
ncbi:hypothetical protein ACFSL6_22515 [Paenibacillus thailandensis]|uniref:hypothetical protein n=1 Tax=Paenibacillus thailandensis TaxID=393250 RepID=UPI0036304318